MSDIHGDDIAYTLSEERILYPDGASTSIIGEYVFYCLFGIFLFFVGVYNMVISKKNHLLESLAMKIKDHKELAISTILLGYLLIVFEFIAMSVRIADATFFGFHAYIWLPTSFSFLFVGCLVMKGCVRPKCKPPDSEILADVTVMFLATIFILFYFYFYGYALPTFLLLLVYPTKVIAIVAYLVAFIFVVSAIYSICLRLIITFTKHPSKSGCNNPLMCCTMFINCVVILVFPFLMTAILFNFLYDFVLSEASPITNGPYAVLSLIPSVAISIAIWMVKKKVFSDTAKNDEKQGRGGNQTHNLSYDDKENGERLLPKKNSPATYGTPDNV